MRLDDYKLLEETDDHYRLDDGSGVPFRVAKKGLGEGLRSRLVQHFARGGEVLGMAKDASTGTIFSLDYPSVPGVAASPDVVADAVPTPEPRLDPAVAHLQPSDFSFQLPEGPPPVVQAAPPAGNRLSPEDLAVLNGQAPPEPAGPTHVMVPAPNGQMALRTRVQDLTPDQRIQFGIDKPVLAPPPAAAAPAPAPAPTGPATPANAVPPSGGVPGLSAAEKQIEEGMRAQAQAVKAQAAAELQLREQQEAQRQTLANEYSRRLGEYQARGDALFNNILSQKVDPNRLWNQRSTGQKLGSVAAIIMSGIGQALQAQAGINAPNAAMQLMEQAIDRDIDAQKADIAKGQSLLAHHAQGGRDMAAAYQLTKADMLDGFAGQLQKQAIQFAGQKNDAATTTAVGELRMRAAQARQQAANQDFEKWYKMQQLEAEKATALAKAKQLDPAQQKQVLEIEDRYQNMRANIAKLKGMIAADGTWNLTGPHNAKLNAILEDVATDMAKLRDPGSIVQKNELEAAKKALFEPSLWSKDANAQATLDNVMGMAQQRRDIAYRVRQIGGAGPASLRQGRE